MCSPITIIWWYFRSTGVQPGARLGQEMANCTYSLHKTPHHWNNCCHCCNKFCINLQISNLNYPSLWLATWHFNMAGGCECGFAVTPLNLVDDLGKSCLQHHKLGPFLWLKAPQQPLKVTNGDLTQSLFARSRHLVPFSPQKELQPSISQHILHI